MFQCVLCEDWFHDTCIGIVSSYVFLDLFATNFCKSEVSDSHFSLMCFRPLTETISTTLSAATAQRSTHSSAVMLRTLCL